MRLLAVFLALALGGCGGGQEETPPQRRFPDARPVTIASVFGMQSPVITGAMRARSEAPVAPATPASQTVPGVAAAEDAVFSIEDERGNAGASLELRSLRGRGFPELKLMLRARRIGSTAGPEPVRPSCRETTRCSYPLTRDYLVILSDDRFMQLVARDDGIAVVARTMRVDRLATAEVRFLLDNQVVSKRAVVLLPD